MSTTFLNSIELSSHDQSGFLRYLAYQYKHSVVARDIKNHFILVDSETDAYVYPSFGEFLWEEDGESYKINYHEEGSPIASALSPVYFKRLVVYHSDITKLKAFVHKALSFQKPPEPNKIMVYYSESRGFWEPIRDGVCVQSLKNIYLPNEMKTQIIDTIATFLRPETKERYIRFGRPYKLTFLFTGVPGCGKTSLIKAMAAHFQRDIYHLNISKTLTDEPLIDLIHSIKPKGVLLIEDIDSFFEERKAVDCNISFAGTINIMDGALSNTHGLITFLTANHPEKLDRALIRPGRVDHIFKFDFPTKTQIEEAFRDMTDNEDSFDAFYAKIRNLRTPMSTIIDFLFRHPEDYMEKIHELVQHVQTIHQIYDQGVEKLYT